MRFYNNLHIYYFSGTGNALSAAKWIKEKGEENNIATQIQSIEKNSIVDTEQKDGKTLIAFTYPTHGFAPPWIMLKFMWRFHRISNADVMFINTKAGMMLWKFYLPGMTGLAQWLPIFMFWLKGYKVKGALPLDMPHSWISFFPPNPESWNVKIAARCQRIVGKMCNRVFTGKRYFRYTVWTQMWFDLMVSWITPLYVFGGRFFIAKTLFSSYKCYNCRICEKYCPVNAIEIMNNMPYWKYTCESCMRCANICPQKSIQSWVTRIMLLFYALIYLGFTFTNLNYHILTLTATVLFFPIYWLFIKLMHVKVFNVLFTYTSLTRYWGRYIAKGLKIKDLK